MHENKLKTGVATKAYRDGYALINWRKKKPARKAHSKERRRIKWRANLNRGKLIIDWRGQRGSIMDRMDRMDRGDF